MASSPQQPQWLRCTCTRPLPLVPHRQAQHLVKLPVPPQGSRNQPMQCLLACRWYARGCCAFATLHALAPATTGTCLVRQQRDGSASMRQR